MCLKPVTLIKKIISSTGKVHDIVPCGKCHECKRSRQHGWTFRLTQEEKRSTSSAFLTFTYETEPRSPNGLPTLQKKDFQNFMKRFRKRLPKKNHPSYNPLKYYAVGEYGDRTQRPHYHAIMFNIPRHYLDRPEKLLNLWGHGHIYIDQCNNNTIQYVTGYVMKQTWKPNHCEETGLLDDRNPQFSLMSKNMGKEYLTPQMTKYLRQNQISYVTLSGGNKAPLPRYYRDKVYPTQEERDILNEVAILENNEALETRFKHVNINQWKLEQFEIYDRAQKAKTHKL